MKAVVVREPGGPEVLAFVDRPDPDVPPAHVRVAVRYAGLNRADLLQRAGHYPAPRGVAADIPGLEYAGVVDAIGWGVTRFEVGDRVFGLVPGAAHASLVVAHEREVARTPACLDDREAAAVPEAFVTAYDAFFARARLVPGERVLVHACGSGVGTAAIQIAKSFGCSVVGTSRTREKLERCRALGLDHGIVPRGAAFAEEVMKATGGAGADVIVDLVGGAYVAEDLAAAAMRARIVVVGLTAGASADLNLGVLLRKRVEIIGTVLRSRPLEEKIEAARVLERSLSPLFEARRLKPIIDRVYPAADAAQAHQALGNNDSFGKILLAF